MPCTFIDIDNVAKSGTVVDYVAAAGTGKLTPRPSYIAAIIKRADGTLVDRPISAVTLS